MKFLNILVVIRKLNVCLLLVIGLQIRLTALRHLFYHILFTYLTVYLSTYLICLFLVAAIKKNLN